MANQIKIKLPDGSVKDVPQGTTALDVAKSISPRLADAALVAKTNGDLIDLTRPIEKDTDLRILTEKDPESLQVYRHSSAHLLAAAVLELFPETKLGHGPATETGFFYDFYRPTAFVDDATNWRAASTLRMICAALDAPLPPQLVTTEGG